MARSLISTRTITDIRLNVDEAAMPDTLTIVRSVRVPNGRGGSVETQTQTTYPCRWAIVKSRISEEGGTQIQAHGSFQPALPLAADVRDTDTAIFHNEKYEIVWTPEPSAHSTSKVIGLEFIGPVTPITDSVVILGVDDTILSIEV